MKMGNSKCISRLSIDSSAETPPVYILHFAIYIDICKSICMDFFKNKNKRMCLSYANVAFHSKQSTLWTSDHGTLEVWNAEWLYILRQNDFIVLASQYGSVSVCLISTF